MEACLSVLRQSNNAADADNGCKPIIDTVKDKIELAVSCMYACNRQVLIVYAVMTELTVANTTIFFYP